MSSVVIKGDTSGQVTLDAPAIAGTTVYSFTDKSGTIAPIVSGTAVTASGTSVDFTDIPSWVKKITVMFAGVSTNGSSTPYLIQIGASGGVETSGYLGSSFSLVSGTSPQGDNSTVGFSLKIDNDAANSIHGSMTITNITGSTWVASGVFSQSNRPYATVMASSKSITGSLNRLRITTSNGTDTFDAGTINILYE